MCSWAALRVGLPVKYAIPFPESITLKEGDLTELHTPEDCSSYTDRVLWTSSVPQMTPRSVSGKRNFTGFPLLAGNQPA